MAIEKLTGLIAAPHTIFDAQGEVDLDAIDKQAELLVKQGVKGAYISGSTGEGISCSVAERLAVMDRWVKVAKGRLKLIVHIGALSLKDVEVLGRHADELAIDAVSVVPANYFKPGCVATLVEYCRVAAAFAPHKKFYYYHSSLSGINLSMVEFLRQADGVIPTLAGIKFNSVDLYEYQNCCAMFDGKYDIVYGTDEFFAGALALGAKAFIGSTYNYMAKTYYDIWDAFNRHALDEVQAGMRKVCQGVDLLVKYGGVAAGKAMLGIHGLEGGDVRLPLKSLTAEQKQTIREELRKILA